MSTLQIMPFEARERRFQSLQSAAEEATLLVPKHKNVLHFIESNTQEATINHLKNDCIVPVFSKDNELTVSHAAFIETVGEAVQNFFSGERIEQPGIRVSHIIKGRVPSANYRIVIVRSTTSVAHSLMKFHPFSRSLKGISSILLLQVCGPSTERTYIHVRQWKGSALELDSRTLFAVTSVCSQTD